MRYFGDFRSLDTSVDPQGQKYRVLIFTGYDGNSSGRSYTGPYPWKYNSTFEATVGNDNHLGDFVEVKHWYPINGTELTLARHPFEVTYTGDTNNINKPYRCSSATVSFLQSSLNTDFINSFGQSVLVMLLKWNNDVYESSSTTMKNAVTGEQISKVRYRYYDTLREGYVNQRYDYDPWAYDKFCYTVEWVGFSTPTMLNVEYDHVFDKFVLQCQDALSTLKYVEFERTEQMEQIINTLFRGLAKICTYKDIYITTSIHLPAPTNDLDMTHPTSGPAMRWLAHQQDNFIDEDGEPLKYLDVIEDIMEYLCLTAIPYQDKLFIVNSASLGNGFNDYNHYQFQSDHDILPWILPANLTSTTPSDLDLVNIVDTVRLNKDSFCGGTQLSSNFMYNKVKVVCDEMRPDPLLPSVTDAKNFEYETAAMQQPIAKNVYSRYVTSTPGTYEEEDFHYFESYFNRPAIDDIKFYRYPSPPSLNSAPYIYMYNNWDYTAVEVIDADLEVWHNMPVASGPSSYNYIEALRGVGTTYPDTSTNYWWGQMSNMAMLVDFSDQTVSSKTEVPTTLSFQRKILLETLLNYNNPRKLTGTGIAHPYDCDDKTTHWNPMLYLKSKPFLGNGKQYLNIFGSFTFYGTSATPGFDTWWPVPRQSRSSSYFTFDANHNYLWVQVKCGEFYLADSGRGNYTWASSPTYVRLWCDNGGLSSGADWRFKTFSLETTVRGINGITVELPVVEGYAEPMQIEFWFDRPLGPGSTSSWCCQSMLINELSIDVYSDEYVETRKRRNPDRDNTEYYNEVIANAIEEYPEISLIHSSCDTAGLSFAETVRHTIRRRTAGESVWKTNPKILNDGDGYFGLPEVVNVHGLTHHLKTPTLVVQTSLFNKLTPLSRVFWQQLADKQFIVDAIDIDYEYEQAETTLVEVKAPSTSIEYATNIFRVNSTRNYHRTRDLMFDGHVARRFETSMALTPVTTTNEIEVIENEVALSTDSEALGAASLNIDWHRGIYRLTTSSEGGMTGYSNHGLVTLSV